MLSLEKTSYPPTTTSSSARTLVLPVMLCRRGAIVATVGFLRGEPQDCNQSLCQKRAPWVPLQLIQPNNKQQITALACRQEQSPRRRARKQGAYSSRLPTQGRHLGSRAGLSLSYTEHYDCCTQPSPQLMENTSWEANGECVGSVEKIIPTGYCRCLKFFFCVMAAGTTKVNAKMSISW